MTSTEDKGATKTISVRAGLELHKDLRVYAAENDTSVDKICLTAIEAWWNQQPEKALYARRRATESSTAPIEAGSVTELSQRKAPKGAKK